MEKSVAIGEKILAATGAEALFVPSGDYSRYLTGFVFEDGFVIVDNVATTLYTDKRYLEAAKAALSSGNTAVKEIDKKIPVKHLLSPYKRVALPMEEISYASYARMADCGACFIDATQAFKEAMAIKTEEELAHIKKACSIAEKALQTLLPTIKEGQTEKQVAAKLEYLMKTDGADGTSFDTIVAFGAHAAVPHHKTGDTPLKFGDEILIDFGCKVEGYCSDMTRTFLFGDDGNHEEFKKAYAAVLAAHEKVLSSLRSGMTAGQADEIARSHLVEAGYGDYFTHSLGHGIGLRIHEFPTLAPKREDVLQDNMVFSDEPGVYVEGEYGIRIEDTVALKSGKAVSFMTMKKDLIIL